MKKVEQQPFSNFGAKLKCLREQESKSWVEVSGAVEIDEQKLKDYELGKIRPPEDVLLLLIQHFDLNDAQAKELWRLAGYGDLEESTSHFGDDLSSNQSTKTIMVSSHDARIVYTDLVQVIVNNYGVIVNFMQGAGVNNQPLAVSRVGMSIEHARSVIDVLTKTLEQANDVQTKSEPKQLPATSSKEQQG